MTKEIAGRRRRTTTTTKTTMAKTTKADEEMHPHLDLAAETMPKKHAAEKQTDPHATQAPTPQTTTKEDAARATRGGETTPEPGDTSHPTNNTTNHKHLWFCR